MLAIPLLDGLNWSAIRAVARTLANDAPVDVIAGPHPTVKWSGGGQFPDLAIWRLPAANGQDYLAGIDSQVYTASQLPLAPAAGA